MCGSTPRLKKRFFGGIREAKDISEYDNLAAAAYLRAKEDYLMGINFSRVLTLRYGNSVTNYLGGKYQAISVGRVMTCVLDGSSPRAGNPRICENTFLQSCEQHCS